MRCKAIGGLAAAMLLAVSIEPSCAAMTPPGALSSAAASTDVYAVARGGGRGFGGRGVAAGRGLAGAPRGIAVRRGGIVTRGAAVGLRRAAVIRPVRRWVRRPHFGTVIGGVALGTIIAVTAVGLVPAAPAPNVCWYWADPTRTQGYWDYC